ncbi:MAG: RraA family protein [Acidobacteriaceae bacterium]
MNHAAESGASPQPQLNAEELEALRSISSPTIANAIETFDVRPRGEGYTNAGIRCLFPDRGAILGYACTAMILSSQPAAPNRLVDRTKYWEYTMRAPLPKVSVLQDMSEEPLGAYIGEVNSHIHAALGSSGVITNGTVRDIEEVRGTGFQVFASGVSVSHGFAHLEDFNRPVTVFGMLVHPGDLIHADQHGAVIIPQAVAREVAATSKKIELAERGMIALCKSDKFAISELDKLISPEY